MCGLSGCWSVADWFFGVHSSVFSLGRGIMGLGNLIGLCVCRVGVRVVVCWGFVLLGLWVVVVVFCLIVFWGAVLFLLCLLVGLLSFVFGFFFVLLGCVVFWLVFFV